MLSSSDPRSRRTIPILAVGSLVLVVLIGGWFLFGPDGGEPVDVDASGSASTTAPSSTASTTTSASGGGATSGSVAGDGSVAERDRSAWVGRYRWDEFAEGDPGSDQTLVHELVLDAPAENGEGAEEDLAGRLSQNGFQTAVELTVVARPIEGGVAIEVVSVDAGSTSLGPGDVVVHLTGEPAEPLTTIGALIPLIVDRPTTGTYFLPDRGDPRSGSDDAGTDRAMPATFWAIEAASFDLIEIDTATGAEVGRVLGWGGDAGEVDDPFFQALQRVDVGPDGWLWVDDCCEPAAGNIFGLDPARITSVDQVLAAEPTDGASLRLTGLNPLVSPDGSLVAYGNYTFDVAVVDRSGQPVASLLGGDDVTFPTPVAWLDEATLAVAEPGVDQTDITFWDLRDPARPVPIGRPATVAGNPIDGAGWLGAVLVMASPEPFGDDRRSGTVVELETSSSVELPAGLRSLDRDPSGEHLLTVGADGLARLGPPDGTGPALSTIEVIWASW